VNNNVTLREEQPADLPAIHMVHEIAFARPDEADLVDALRAEGVILCSLVAEIDGRIAGHLLFTRMWIDSFEAAALAPVAVLPGCQRQGIAANLIRHGLNRLRSSGESIVIVLGEPHYYNRFGFSVESARDLHSPFPPEAYMALELQPSALDGVQGAVRYAKSFGLAEPFA
jgi:putative acetyltransferase